MGLNYMICLANNFSKCVAGAENYEEALKKFNYWTEVKKVAVTIRKI